MSGLLILYHSEHHQNTKKLLEAVAEQIPLELVNLAELAGEGGLSLDRRKAVGFASGVYFSKLHPSLSDFLRTHGGAISCKKAFVLYTCGSGGGRYAQPFTAQLAAAGFQTLGTYRCKGFDTYGPFGIIGGIAKKHPDQADVAAAVRFLQDIAGKL